MIIIGAGITGLTAGILLQKKGVRTTIYEKHTAAGGLCAYWRRGEYTFNGGLHWLLGARAGSSFHTLWKRVFDVDGMACVVHRERIQIELGGRTFHYYNDIDELERYLLELSPVDEGVIRRWCADVRTVVRNLPYLPPVWPKSVLRKIVFAHRFLGLLPVVGVVRRRSRQTLGAFAQGFKSPFLRKAISRLYGSSMSMMHVIFAQAYAAAGVAQYPVGGAMGFVSRLVEEYERCGGVIHYGAGVERVLVENGAARGVVVGGEEVEDADGVVSSAPWQWTMDVALEGKYYTRETLKLRDAALSHSFCMLFLGVGLPMHEAPHAFRFETEAFEIPDGTVFRDIEVNVYNFDETSAPKGKVTITVNLLTTRGEYWCALRKNDIERYRREKEELVNVLMERLTVRFGEEWRKAVEVVDLATPATYERYTGNPMGAVQGWAPAQNIFGSFPVRAKVGGLRNFAFASQWLTPGGGIPNALRAALALSEK